jgi:hypothetical protein
MSRQERDRKPVSVLLVGFPGAGKTKLILAASRSLQRQGIRAAAVLNDQRTELVDTRLIQENGLPADQVTGGWFCCRFFDRVNGVERLQVYRPDVIFAEVVGNCTHISATTLQPLKAGHGVPAWLDEVLTGALTCAGAVGKIIDGWHINGNTTFQSGFLLVITGGKGSGAFAGTQRPNWNGQAPTRDGRVQNRLLTFFNITDFSFSAPFTFGNAPRPMPDLRSQGVANFDMSLSKDTRIREKLQLRFRAEVFNAFNHVQFGVPKHHSRLQRVW